MFKTILKVLLALGAVLAAVAAYQYFTSQKKDDDYVEIYDDDTDGEYF